MYTDMQMWTEVKRRVLVEGVSKRQVLRETGMYWRTLEKILTFSEPPGYRLKGSRPQPKLDPYLDRIRQIIEADKQFPRKQRHTGRSIFECLRAEGYTGGETQQVYHVSNGRGGSQQEDICRNPVSD